MPTEGVGRFHDPSHVEEREVIDAKTRKFEGDGTPFLIVPGCKSVEAVRVGTIDLPPFEERRYLHDLTGVPGDTVREPLWSLSQTPDGRPVLLRSLLSNLGHWQKAQPVFVTGEWEEKTEGQQAEASTAEGQAAEKGQDKGGSSVQVPTTDAHLGKAKKGD